MNANEIKILLASNRSSHLCQLAAACYLELGETEIVDLMNAQAAAFAAHEAGRTAIEETREVGRQLRRHWGL